MTHRRRVKECANTRNRHKRIKKVDKIKTAGKHVKTLHVHANTDGGYEMSPS